MKKKVSKCLLLAFIVTMLGMMLTACDDGKDYTCDYCGREMEHYWSYHDGYVCYSCDKKYFD